MCPEVTGLVLLDPVVPVLASADAPRPSHLVVTEGPGGPRRHWRQSRKAEVALCHPGVGYTL